MRSWHLTTHMRIKLKRRDFLKYSFRGIVAATLGKGYYNTTSNQIELVRLPVKINNLPASLQGLKIGLLTDLHSSYIVSNKLLRAAGQLIMSEKPDVIVMTGDYISGSTKFLSGSVGEFKKEHLIGCCNALSHLKAPLGIYGVLGNHDEWSGPEAVKEICETFTKQIGMVWLRNRSIELKKGGSSFHLLGVDDYWAPSCSLANACKGTGAETIKILLSHNPDINDDITLSRERIDLVLSGHTHGGQIVLPFLGQPVMPSKFGQKYRAGLVRDGDRQTYISRGVGCLLAPIRLNCLPEATVLTLT
jgi:predicted MPP superfamily phosphohydrolase